MSRSTALPASSGVGRVLSEFPFLYRALRTPVLGVLERWFRLRVEVAALERGRVVGIFPEGPFSVSGRLERGLPGVALLALHSGAPVLPAGIRGTWEALRGRRFYVPRATPLAVRFGPPRRFSPNGACA